MKYPNYSNMLLVHPLGYNKEAAGRDNYFIMLWCSPDSWLRFIGNMKDFIVFARNDKRLSDISG
jgi:hypothetical protein